MIALARQGGLRSLLHNGFFKDVAAGYVQGTRNHHARSLRYFERFLERPATIEDLCAGKLLPWREWLFDKPLAAETVEKHLACLVCFWGWLAKKRIAAEFPALPRFVTPAPLVRALSMAQVDKFLESCAAARGDIAGIPAADYWTALARFCLDHGERTGAILSIPWAWLDLDRGFMFVGGEVRKGKKSLPYPLRAWVVEALRKIEAPRRRLVFPWVLDKSSFHNHWHRLWKRAGLPLWPRIGPQTLRRTHATHLKRNGGDPTESLHHSCTAVTERYYLDWSQLQPERHADKFSWGK